MTTWPPERIAGDRAVIKQGGFAHRIAAHNELSAALDEIERLQARVAEAERMLRLREQQTSELKVRDLKLTDRDQRREQLLRDALGHLIEGRDETAAELIRAELGGER